MNLQRVWEDLWARLRNLFGFLRYVGRRFVDDECLNASATLAYTTLLSLVPLFAVSFTVLTAFPVFEAFNERIQDFLFSNLVPASGEVVQTYMQEFASRAAGLTAAGMMGIMVVSVLMVSAIDRALNRIWRVTRPRRPVQSFMVYWTVITVGPFLVAISLLVSSYLVTLTEYAGEEHARGLQEVMLQATPVIALLAAFTFLYSAVPNRRVPFVHALAGAAVAACLFELAKFGFAWFVTSFPSYEAIYGALATLPIFLVWIYLCWVVVLFGAEFTHSMSAYGKEKSSSLTDPRMSLLLSVRLTGDLWRAQQSGRAMSKEQLFALEPEAGEATLQAALDALANAKVIRRTDDGSWVLVRDPSTFTLLDLYRGSSYVLAELPDSMSRKDDWNKMLGGVLHEAMTGVERALARPLQDIFQSAELQAEQHEGGLSDAPAEPEPVKKTLSGHYVIGSK